MVAYSFQRQFVAPILAGRKRHTIRAERTGRCQHAKLGDKLQLYTGMRTRHCKLIGRAVCQGRQPVRIDLVADIVALPGRFREGRGALDAFAMSDGFADWDELKAFWREQHPGVTLFSGSLITWACFEPAEGQS